MADEGISTKVSVLGDKEYKQAMQDIGRRLTVLNTEMAATSSAFGDQAGSMEAMQAKGAGLHKVYEAQAQKVNLVAEQLNKAKAEYGENSKQADTLQIALNRAVTAMNKTGAQIAENDKSMAALADSTAQASAEEEKAGSASDKLAKTLSDSANKSAAYDQQLREVERSLKRGGDESDNLAKKQELLQAKFDAQATAVDATAAAYRESVAQSGEFSAESVALSKKLQDQKDALGKTQEELNKNTAAMQKADSAGDGMTDSVDDAAKALKDEGDAADKAETENKDAESSFAALAECIAGRLSVSGTSVGAPAGLITNSPSRALNSFLPR